MAIKERKQITGTTEQINAYEGHEGQIVWDKDKKTLVGMSGTAGTNYPLAQQAYVDTKFLPLTGGNMTGVLVFNNLGKISQDTTPRVEELIIEAYDSANQWLGGLLSCRGHSGSIEAERGSFVLGARNKDSSVFSFLLGTPAGNLTWKGNEVLRITGSGNGWVRFNPNLQICFGSGQSTQDGTATISYGAPLSVAGSVNVNIIGDSAAAGFNWTTLVTALNSNFFKVTTFRNGVVQPYVPFYWYVIGYYN